MEANEEKEYYENYYKLRETLLFKSGVYSNEKAKNVHHIRDLKIDESAIDIWCPICNKEKTFNCCNNDCIYNLPEKYANDNHMYYSGPAIETKDDIFYKSYICPTCKNKVIYIFKIEGLSIRKIAQYPSLRDVTPDSLKKYHSSEFVDEEDFKEINKALTLSSESFYVAAFTHMRRVFENLINRTFDKGGYQITKEDFYKLHMDEKIKNIRDGLPIDDDIYNILYKNLSLGIHQLSEEDCKNRYDILIEVMQDILEEEIRKKEKKSRLDKLKKLPGGANGQS